jgi:hypothetical protein
MVRARSSRHPWLSYAVCIAALFTAGAARAQPMDPFPAATAAFEAGDFLRALSLFQAARESGVDSAALYYNLGVSQYRVGDHAEAAATFALVRDRFPDFAALAEYNRGLAMLALGREEQARAAFERARAEGDERLRELAGRALDSLAPAPTPAAATAARWVGYFDGSVGHDDNVALVDALSLPATISASSSFTELAGYAGASLGNRVPLRLGFSGYTVRYADAPQFDQDAVRVDLGIGWSPGTWDIEAGPYLGETWLDGDGFERTVGVGLSAVRPLTANLAFELRASRDDLEAPSSRFDFVEGTRERLRLGLDHSGNRTRLRVSYELEANDRAAASVSPERQRLALRYERTLTDRWSLDASAAYRRSDFDDLALPRRERLTEASGAARRRLPRGWLLSAQYRYADNDSSAPQFSYTSHRLTVGVGKGF